MKTRRYAHPLDPKEWQSRVRTRLQEKAKLRKKKSEETESAENEPDTFLPVGDFLDKIDKDDED